MARSRNSNAVGGGWSPAQLLAVWNKGRTIAGFDAATWRWDCLGNTIKFDLHGSTTSSHGWEVDHIKPVARGGTDDLSNLQPLQWQANRDKADTWP